MPDSDGHPDPEITGGAGRGGWGGQSAKIFFQALGPQFGLRQMFSATDYAWVRIFFPFLVQ